MDYLWSPWRFRYVSQAEKPGGCVFCEMAAADPSHDRDGLVLFRGRCNYAILNLYPYTTGHTLVIPYAHVAQLSQLGTDTLGEMMALAQRINAALEKTYHPDGYNLGMNIGKAAGAGVADHVHLHFLPRWEASSNFMTVIGETRVLPEELVTTYDKLLPFFREFPKP
ncbi:MAG: HIT domain-containing protein [Terriglobia bacterium]|jgi:ATP adenylyltransferase